MSEVKTEEIPIVEYKQLRLELWESSGKEYETAEQARRSVGDNVARFNERHTVSQKWGTYQFEKVRAVVIARLEGFGSIPASFLVMFQTETDGSERAKEQADLRAFQKARYEKWLAEYKADHA